MKTRTKNAVKRLLGGAISVALSLAMALCIFAGTGIEVRAEGKWEFVSVTLPDSWDEFIGMTFVDYYDGAFDSNDIQEIVSLMNSDSVLYVIGKDSEDDLFYMAGRNGSLMSSKDFVSMKIQYGNCCYILQRKSGSTTTIDVPWYYKNIALGDYSEESLYNAVGQHGLNFNSTGMALAQGTDVSNNSICIWDAYAVGSSYVFFYCKKDSNGNVTFNGNTDQSATDYLGLQSFFGNGYNIYIIQPKNTESTGSSESSGSVSDSYTFPHTHSYAWETVQEVTAEQDGVEEYRCSCGDVQARCVLPRYMAIVKGLYGAVKDAPQNGTAVYDTGSAFTMTDYVIRKLAERSDVTTVVTFEYQGQAYRMTIPAGADYTGLLADEEYFYGYFYFADVVGATIEAL